MSYIKNGGQAFPGKRVVEPKLCGAGTAYESGMTLRDYLSAKAMQGMCANGDAIYRSDDEIAKDAYAIADAMLRAREQS